MTDPGRPDGSVFDDDFQRAVAGRLADVADLLPAPLGECARPLLTTPGKQLRSGLVEVCSRFGRPDRHWLVELGVIVELLHAASLLHDDVIDRTGTRRGLPTAHVVAGRDAAVLAGVAIFSEVAMRSAALRADIAYVVSHAASELACGELADVERAYDLEQTVDSYRRLAGRKTGAMFALACDLGGRAARLTAGDVDRLRSFGMQLGIAFQILDDCLDLRQSGSGKPIGTDHVLGVFGLPTILALGTSVADELTSILLASFTSERIDEVHRLVESSGALDVAREMVGRHLTAASSALGPMAESVAGAQLVRAAEALVPAS